MLTNSNKQVSIQPDAESISRQQQGLPSHFARSIPGQSLTQPPGKYAWEKPAAINDIEEAKDAVMSEIMQPSNMKSIILLVDAGVAVESIVRAITFDGFVQGKWTPDIAELLNPILTLEFLAIVNSAGIEDIRILNKYETKEVKTSDALKIMKDLNPKKYGNLKSKALKAVKEQQERVQPSIPQEGSFIAIEPEIPPEMPIDTGLELPDRSFVQDQPVEFAEEEMPVEFAEEEMPVEFAGEEMPVEEFPEEII